MDVTMFAHTNHTIESVPTVSAVDVQTLAQLVCAYAPHDGRFPLAIPQVYALRLSHTDTELVYTTYQPSLCIVCRARPAACAPCPRPGLRGAPPRAPRRWRCTAATRAGGSRGWSARSGPVSYTHLVDNTACIVALFPREFQQHPMPLRDMSPVLSLIHIYAALSYPV